MSTQDEAWEAQAKELHGRAATRQQCFGAGWNAALADTLGLLERLRERYGTPVSIGRRFFMSSTEIIIDGIGYSRDEARALLAGKEESDEHLPKD